MKSVWQFFFMSWFLRISQEFLKNSREISLLGLDLEAFSFHFSLSISISRHFHFTFHSRNEWKEKQIHFSFLEKSESISDFTLFLEKKEWNYACNFAFCHEKFTFLIKVKVCYMKIIWTKILKFLEFLILKNFSRILEKFHFSISISRHFHFTFHSRSRSWDIFISLFILEMGEPDFYFTFHFSKWVNQIFISLFTSRTSNIHSRRTL